MGVVLEELETFQVTAVEIVNLENEIASFA